MPDNITLMDHIEGRIYFVYKLLIKGFGYFVVSYLFIDNWFDALLFFSEVSKKSDMRPRKKDMSRSVIARFIEHVNGNIVFYDTRSLGNTVEFGYKGTSVCYRFVDGLSLAMAVSSINEQFIGNEYGPMEVKGKDVLDIGAEFGDTATYFICNGAKRVVAVEPYPYSFGLAKTNIALNQIGGKVELVNAACGARKGSVIIDPFFKNCNRDDIKHFKRGMRIPVMDLKTIVDKYRLNSAALKVDCEGGEYDIILDSSNDVLRKFKCMVIEYHFGFRNLEEKLRGAGFKVMHSHSFYQSRTNDKRRVLCGLLFAERLNAHVKLSS